MRREQIPIACGLVGSLESNFGPIMLVRFELKVIQCSVSVSGAATAFPRST